MKLSQNGSRARLKLYLMVMLLFAVFPLHSVAQTVTVSGIDYTIDTVYKEARCKGFTSGHSKVRNDLTIESSVTYNGVSYPVTSIGNEAFKDCFNVTGTLTIPNSVTRIGDFAFYNCCQLTGSLTIPNSVKFIGEEAFAICFGFTGSLIIPDSVLSIGDYAFHNCESMTGSLIISNSVRIIGEGAFSACFGLTGSLIIPNSVTTIGKSAFEFCRGFNGSLTLPNSITTIDESTFCGCEGLVGSVTVPSSVTKIGEEAFYGCKKIESLYLPAELKSIGNYAFFSCPYLETIDCEAKTPPTLGDGQYETFGSKNNIKLFVPAQSINLYKVAKEWSKFRNIGPRAVPASISLTPSSTSIYASEDVTINPKVLPENADKTLIWTSSDESVATVKDGAVHGLKPGKVNITATTIVDDLYASCEVTVLPYEAMGMKFYYDSYLGGVVITSLPDLESYIIPTTISVQNGNKSTIYYVKDVQLESLPQTLKKVAYPEGIGHNIPSSIISIAYSKTDSEIKDGVIVDKISSAIIYVDISKEGSYLVDSNIKTIKKNAFAYCSGIREITIPSTVTSIETDAFSACTGLSQVIFEDDNSAIEIANAFSGGCTMDYLYMGRSFNNMIAWPTSLKAIETGRYVDKLPANAFTSLPNLYSLTIGVGMRSIDARAFSYSKITKVLWLPNTPPTGYTSIRADINYVSTNNYEVTNKVVSANLSSKFMVNGLVYVFNRQASDRTCALIDSRYNRYTTSLDVPHKVTYQGIEFTVEEINDYALYCNQYYKSATIGDGIVSIGKYALYNCKAIQNAPYIGKSVKTIDDYAFNSCSDMPSIVIPDATEYLGVSSLANCTSLESAILGKGMRVIERGCFSGDKNLRQMVVPANVNSIANEVFDGCTSLSYLEISDRNTTLTLGYSKHNSQYKPSDGVIGGLSTAGVPLFNDCHLKEVYIGGDISYSTSPADGYSPFYRNDYLEKVNIHNNETDISDNEFYGCRNLKEVVVGNDVVRVGDYAFSGCLSIEYFTLGSHVQAIGVDAFSDCDRMVELKSFNSKPPVCGEQATDDINKFNCTLYVPNDAVSAYQNADQWKNFFHIKGMSTESILVESITLNPNEWCGEIGSTVTLSASVLPENADNKSLKWSTSDVAVATVDENGKVWLMGEGTCVITARAIDGSDVSDTCYIEVKSSDGDGDGDGDDDGELVNVSQLYLDSTKADGDAGWTFDNIYTDPEVDYVWSWKAYNKAYYLNGSAYVYNPFEAEAIAISPVIDLSGATAVSCSFEHAAKFQTTLCTLCGIMVREEGETAWTNLSIPKWPYGIDWSWVNSGRIDLSAYAGKKIQIGFKYGSTSYGADTWEIRNLEVSITKRGAGVETIETDEIEPVYYTLQGVEIHGKPAPGIYIRRQGKITSKVIVK